MLLIIIIADNIVICYLLRVVCYLLFAVHHKNKLLPFQAVSSTFVPLRQRTGLRISSLRKDTKQIPLPPNNSPTFFPKKNLLIKQCNENQTQHKAFRCSSIHFSSLSYIFISTLTLFFKTFLTFVVDDKFRPHMLEF